MKSADCKNGNYMLVNHQRIAVSREVFNAINKENESIRYQARKENRCARGQCSRCPGDCQICPWKNDGIISSLDNLTSSDFLIDETDIEAEFILKETAMAVYTCADQLVKDGSRILELFFVQECSCREVARRIGVSHTCIKNRLRTLLSYFREHEDFFL